jgi:hypothetical protein
MSDDVVDKGFQLRQLGSRPEIIGVAEAGQIDRDATLPASGQSI